MTEGRKVRFDRNPDPPAEEIRRVMLGTATNLNQLARYRRIGMGRMVKLYQACTTGDERRAALIAKVKKQLPVDPLIVAKLRAIRKEADLQRESRTAAPPPASTANATEHSPAPSTYGRLLVRSFLDSLTSKETADVE